MEAEIGLVLDLPVFDLTVWRVKVGWIEQDVFQCCDDAEGRRRNNLLCGGIHARRGGVGGWGEILLGFNYRNEEGIVVGWWLNGAGGNN